MKRCGVLCGVGGMAAALLFLAFGVARSRPPEETSPVARPPAAPDPVPPADASPAPPPAVKAKAATIDDLLNRLDAIKAQKAVLDKAEKETIALLREKLKQQRQRLQKLGVHVEPGDTPPAPPPLAPREPS